MLRGSSASSPLLAGAGVVGVPGGPACALGMPFEKHYLAVAFKCNHKHAQPATEYRASLCTAQGLPPRMKFAAANYRGMFGSVQSYRYSFIATP
eukprot:scaffold49596_cov41-Prasinocladus_malaysianus.AAC.5